MNVLHHPNKELRIKAKPVALEAINTPEMKAFIKEMKATMKKERGVGLAATQIGIETRVFVAQTKKGVEAFFNPVITKRSKHMVESHEGCLSVPGIFGLVERHRQIRATALNEKGQPVEIATSGLLSIIFQHEIDHLDGVLFIDRAYHTEALHPDKKLFV
jgi:peptide deformylase